MSFETRRIRFPGAAGAELAGRLEAPIGRPLGYALFAHCFTCSKDLKAVVRISRALAEHGFAVLRFDFTGIGESEGEFADTDFSSNLDDLVAAADYLRLEHASVDLLVGHSLGGAAVLAAAHRIPDAKAVATIGAPSSTDHLRTILLEHAPELATDGEAEIELAGRRIHIRRQLLDDLEEEHLRGAITSLNRPLLVFHSPVDEVVAIDHARSIFKAARHPKSFVSLDDADHLLLKRAGDSRFVGGVLAAWAARYLDADGDDRGRTLPPAELAPGEVLVEAGAEGYFNQVVAGRHRLSADEPESVGGTDEGPTPYDLLLAALGACKSITLRMYADRKGWPLTGIRVRLRHDKIHAKDCEECASESGRVDRIDVDLELEGPLDSEQHQRLLEISERCPVHRTLTSETSIRARHGE